MKDERELIKTGEEKEPGIGPLGIKFPRQNGKLTPGNLGS